MRALWTLIALSLFSFPPAFAETYKGEALNQDRKVYSLALQMKEMLKNDELYKDNMYLSQAELSRLSYYLHFYQFSYTEIFLAKLKLQEFYPELSETQQLEAERYFRDFLWIRERMTYYEGLGYKCKYAYYAELDRSIRTSIWNNREKYKRFFPTKEMENAFYEEWDNSPDHRMIAGLC